jgi:hypothetical protein
MLETKTRMSSVNNNGCCTGLGNVLRGVTCNVRMQKIGLAYDKVQKKGYVRQMPCLWGHT